MATYKVLQDIEAEDKFVGPLTLRQFILAGIAFVGAYLSFLFLTKHLWFLDIPLAPITLLAGFLAWPWGRDQPTEVWLLAKIRFFFKPRRRIWDQTGIQELVTITAPKHEESYVSDNLSQNEVKSRLKALADTIDSRGWAVKNASVNLYTQPAYASSQQPTDRLIELSDFTHEVPSTDVQAADDILDEHNNPTAQHLQQMITESSQAHRAQTLKNLEEIREHKPATRHKSGKNSHPDTAQELWFMNQPQPAKASTSYTTFGDDKTVIPGADDSQSTASPLTADEKKLLNQLHDQDDRSPVAYGHTRVIQPLSTKRPARHTKRSNNRDISTSRTPLKPAIIELANNDDLTVATLARQANKQQPPNDEVVVKLR